MYPNALKLLYNNFYVTQSFRILLYKRVEFCQVRQWIFAKQVSEVFAKWGSVSTTILFDFCTAEILFVVFC